MSQIIKALKLNLGLDHIAHHLLGLWALGATPGEMQYMWDLNKPYQAPLEQQHNGKVSKDMDLKDPELFDICLGNNEKYADFLRFFEDEVAEKGVPEVVREYVLKGDRRANDIFCRMYTGEFDLSMTYARIAPNDLRFRRPRASDDPSGLCAGVPLPQSRRRSARSSLCP